ncbi:MAG: sugar phosphate isomerase/epimerase family protein [Armatimonadota bacterium]
MSRLACLNTSTIRPASLPDKIEAAAAAGFQAVELWNDDVFAFIAGGGTLLQVKELLARLALQVPSMIAIMGFVGNTDPGRDQRLEEARRRMEHACELGAPFIVASPPPGRTDLAQCGHDYADLLALGREVGIRPAMEFLGFVDHVNSIRTAREIMDRAGDPHATIVIDWFHMVRGDGRETILEDLRSLSAEQIAIVHLDDVPYTKPFPEMTDGDRVMPGDGDIPIQALHEILDEIGYQGPISLELFNESLWAQDPYEVARLGFEKSRRWFA